MKITGDHFFIELTVLGDNVFSCDKETLQNPLWKCYIGITKYLTNWPRERSLTNSCGNKTQAEHLVRAGHKAKSLPGLINLGGRLPCSDKALRLSHTQKKFAFSQSVGSSFSSFVVKTTVSRSPINHTLRVVQKNRQFHPLLSPFLEMILHKEQ